MHDRPPLICKAKIGAPCLAGLLLGTALSGWTPAILAQGVQDLRVSGFGTLGLTNVSTPHGWGYRRDLGQSASAKPTRADVDSRLGLQLNYAPVSQVEFVAQVLAARSTPGATLADHVEWAFAALYPAPQLAVRLGRINLDAFLMSDHRHVGFAYLPARPPVEFYGLLPTSLDGADVSHWLDIGNARWRLKLFTGRGEGGDRGSKAGLPLNPVLGSSVTHESGGLLVRMGVVRAKIATAPAAIQPLIAGLAALSALPVPSVASQAQALRLRIDASGSAATYLALGARYESGPWLWSAELAKVTGHPFFNLRAGYASVGRRFGEWTAYSGFSQARSGAPAEATPQWAGALALDPSLAAQAQALGTAAANTANLGRPRQRALSLGGRWDFHPQMSLKLQLDQIRTEANGALLWTQPTPDSGRSNVTSVLLDFVF